jgi:glycosyltransferase involved in cell wall biosynthesis
MSVDRTPMTSPAMSPDVAFLVTESSYFLSHRRRLAEACRARGWRAALFTNVAPSDRPALDGIDGLRVVPFDMRRSSHNPLRELATMVRLIGALARERPRLVHAVGLKPVLYGAFAARLLGLDAVCALAGLGYLFTAGRRGPAAGLLRVLVVAWMRLMLGSGRVRVILQNDDDAEALLSHRIVSPDRLVMIRGSGVDLDHFRPTPEPEGVPVFAVVSRMLADKGIREVVLAARLLRRWRVPCRVVLIGDPDPANSSALTRDQLAAWAAEGAVEWRGHRGDVAAVLAESHVAVLPSYREGLPKSLLEAAAAGLPIVTTDVPGCRAVVTDGREGLLVPPRDWCALARAMAQLAQDPGLRKEMGQAARRRAEAEFGDRVVMTQTMDLYRQILGAS